MSYLFVYSAVAVWIAWSIVQHRRNKSKKNLASLRAAWGKPKQEAVDLDKASRYSQFKTESGFHRLSAQTLLDLDFAEVFQFLDRANSRVGQQYLFDVLTRPAADPSRLKSREADIQFFLDHAEERERIQVELSKLGSSDAYQLISLLKPQPLRRPAWLKFATINIGVLLTSLISTVQYPMMFVLFIFSLAVNIVIHYWNKGNVYQYILSFSQLNIAIDVCHRISATPRFEDKYVRESIIALRPFQTKLNLLDKSNDGIKGDLTLIFTYFIELLKASLLIEILTLFDLVEKIESRKAMIQTLIDHIGRIDTCISIASLRCGPHKTCRPDFSSPSKNIKAVQVYHPLIEACTKNDIVVNQRGILITGSNMSGKTTFLRTLVLNSILAQTIHTCFADEFRTPVVRQFSSIRIDDNLLDGKSYYFEEVELMSTLVNASTSVEQNLYVLDEVFKGTNTIERIAAAKAILSYLNLNNNIVIVSTHDIELANMLDGEYELYHFSEAIETGVLKFDHKLKPGPLRTRNAIRILELFNFPDIIIHEAKAVSERLDTAR